MNHTTPDTLSLTIFGITGDLSGRMLLPALYDLALQNLLPSSAKIIGITRRPYTVEQLLKKIERAVTKKNAVCNHAVLAKLGRQIELFSMDLSEQTDYVKLHRHLNALETEVGSCMNRLFYMAVPAQLFHGIVEHMGQAGLNQACPHGSGESRLLVEKPFGYDLTSAQKLINQLHQYFDERQIYRIDHFLAKETAQNILTFRFQNSLFRAVWNRHCISHILVSATETLDIEGRVAFYEQTGALRDMIQSHVLQMLALATMDIPDQLTADAVHTKKLALLQAIVPASPGHAIRGQYRGYRDESGKADSRIETYAALQLAIDNDRWQGVPILLRSGKALAQKTTDITVVFTDKDDRTIDNTLTIRLSPNEGISLHLRAKKPGFEHTMQAVSMDFNYQTSFSERQPTPYERVLSDAFHGDKTLFATSEEVLSSWRIIEPLLQTWLHSDAGLQPYAKGSWGPEAAEKLAHSVRTHWSAPEHG